MTAIDSIHAQHDQPSDRVPAKHGSRWEEGDFAVIMQACREGCGLEEIAVRLERTVQGLRGQLRRMLPAAERHLSPELVLPRLRQLERDGDYDWLAAMAERTVSPWERRREEKAERHERGIGALDDEDLLGIAQAVVDSTVRQSPELRRALSDELHRRELDGLVRRRALAAAETSVDSLVRDGWSYPGERYPSEWMFGD
ncbi:hypothetical protein [Agrococcus baldri]|uniref:hypothetical protein n=1 Tax=Agrococcus baldri TaxID=153730 RepID=UPI000B88F7E2|nr:hypothetical protein [Agrococcus baldri]